MHEICTISFNLSRLLLVFNTFNLIILFLSLYILLCIFNAFSAPCCNAFNSVKHFELLCTWNVLQMNLTWPLNLGPFVLRSIWVAWIPRLGLKRTWLIPPQRGTTLVHLRVLEGRKLHTHLFPCTGTLTAAQPRAPTAPASASRSFLEKYRAKLHPGLDLLSSWAARCSSLHHGRTKRTRTESGGPPDVAPAAASSSQVSRWDFAAAAGDFSSLRSNPIC